MLKKTIFFSLFALSAFAFIGWMFWEHELKFARPTPIPNNFQDVAVGSTIDVKSMGIPSGKSTVLHFFNPDCPCSKFNMKDFEALSMRYRDDVNFYVVLQSSEADAADDFREKYELDVPVIPDVDGVISDHCGIYATPQAVILNANAMIYFKGNYNKSRFCTRKETRYVEIALDSLIANKPLPMFVQNELTLPYGCSLPSDEQTADNNFLKLF